LPLFILMNAHYEIVDVKIPALRSAVGWRLIVDTARGMIDPGEPPIKPGTSIALPARSLLLFEAEH